MATEDFYAALPLLTELAEITYPQNFVNLPEDWFILISDIVGSTKAIEAGRYKDVNLIGACSIISVLNVAKEIEVPFIFGGDGATLLIPPILVEKAKTAMLATQQMSVRAFQLQLRIGIIPIKDILAKVDVKIAKLKISDNYNQAILRGGGITFATDLLKNPSTSELYQIVGDRSILAEDFSGLECRWQDVLSRHGETLSLIIMATKLQDNQNDLVYRQAIAQIKAIYGGDQAMQPVSPRVLRLSLATKQLQNEAKVFVANQSPFQIWLYVWKARLNNLLGMLLIKIKHRNRFLDWARFKTIITESTDYQKFDDCLRMVIAGNAAQRQRLEAYLAQEYASKNLVYGIHVSDRALMTCLVFKRHGRQVHFIDGADGGYAIAAKKLKQRHNIERD
jgi:Protein of unknown function (DUF3095)